MGWEKNFDGWDSRCCAAGSTYPAMKGGKIRIYTMRFCPFSERAVLVASARSLPADIVCINLSSKPEWLLERNPAGTTPTVEVEGKSSALWDSMLVASYLDSIQSPTGAPSLLPSDPWENAQQKLLVEKLAKLHSAIYKWWQNLEDPEAVNGVSEVLQIYENQLQNGEYLSGTEIGWADYMMWPWVERILMMEPAGKLTLKDKFPKLHAYSVRMQARPEIAAVARSPELHWEHVKNVFIHKTPDFDLGITN